MSDIDVILGDDDSVVTLVSGRQAIVEQLKTRQFFKLLRIITRGAGPVISTLEFDGSVDEFTQQLLTMLLFSIPEAEDEVMDFLASMVKPVGLIEGGSKLSREAREKNAELYSDLMVEMYNPELDDTITIVEAIVKNEAEDLQALGKRLMGMFKLAKKTGQLETVELPETSQEENSSEDSPEQ